MLSSRFAVAVCVLVVACAPVRADDDVKPAPITFPFRMKDAKWEEVFAAYSKTTGLQAYVISKPLGSFTFVPVDPNQQLTLAQITDIINDARDVRRNAF